MSSSNLNNLVKTGQLKVESFNQEESMGLMRSAQARLNDALNETLAIESRFDLAYNAAHALALAALRKQGYRSVNRYLVFQVLPYTLGVKQEAWRILAACHDRRILAEYEGCLEIDDQLLLELLRTAKTLLDLLST
jgi:hypothetical protein